MNETQIFVASMSLILDLEKLHSLSTFCPTLDVDEHTKERIAVFELRCHPRRIEMIFDHNKETGNYELTYLNRNADLTSVILVFVNRNGKLQALIIPRDDKPSLLEIENGKYRMENVELHKLFPLPKSEKDALTIFTSAESLPINTALFREH